ncbi:MAG: N-acetylmuramoyl-L-alanine amidase [Deltaproteobacteria bacterium]|nr:N-acetylmuramoyl-L-alanine amidase [Deltaproteobacteria bacterium]
MKSIKTNTKIVKTAFMLLLSFIITTTFSYNARAQDNNLEKLYCQADAAYKKMKKNPKAYKYRSSWLICIDKFSKVYQADPNSVWAAAGLYMTGKLYRELYKYSQKASDKNEAIDIFKRIIKHFPKSGYKAKAKKELSLLSVNQSRQKPKPEKTAPPPKKTKIYLQDTASDSKAAITGIRFWSNPNYTRIVIDSDKKVSYNHNVLKQNFKIAKPKRLYVDFKNTKLKNTIQKNVVINDNLLISVRAAQFDAQQVRVVIDLKTSISYQIFFLYDPFRTVIDIYSSDKHMPQPEQPDDTTADQTQADSKKSPALVKELGLGVRKIIIDAGHGGKDYGAPGYYKGVHEKDIVLQIAKKLAAKIKNELKCEVIMTRNTDKYITLEERTAIANTKKADLFISVHTNAAKNKKAYGIETYFLSPAKSNESMLVAARENAATTKNISELQSILNSLLRSTKVNESVRLAGYVQNSMYKRLKSNYSQIKNKGVKQALFYVLLGAHMPSILIETSFISNARECKRLTNSTYQNRICDGIITGIKQYIKHNNPS